MAYEKTNSKTKILIETTAEGGNYLKFDDIIDFINNNKLNIGMVIDTAHLYAAGYNSEQIIDLIKTNNKIIDCIHLNNPSPNVNFGEHKDQHDISLFNKNGKFSKIEIDNFIEICKFYDLPMILETGENIFEQVNLIVEKYF